MNLRKAAQHALEAMDNLHRTGDTQVFDLCHRETTEALRAALAEQNKCIHGVEDSCKECYMADEQEPVFDCPRCGHCCPQRKPLSDEEIEQAYRHIWHNIPADFDHTSMGWIEQGIRYAEQANGIKGEA